MMRKSSRNQAVAAATAFWSFTQDNKFIRVVFLLFVCLLPTQLGRHFWPDFSIVSGLKIDYLSPTIYLTDYFSIVIIFFWIREKLTEKFKLKSLIHFALVLLFLSVGIYMSQSPLAGWYGFVRFIFFVCLGFSLKNLFKKKIYQSLLVFGLGLSVAIESLLAILQFFNHGSLGGFWYFLGERSFNSSTPGIANADIGGRLVLRPYATFPHPNVLAGFLVISLTIILYSAVLKKGIEKFYLKAVLFIGTVALFLTLSRVAIIIWIVVFSSMLIRRKKLNRFLLISGVLFLICLFLFSPLRYRFEILSFADSSIVDRLSLIRASLEMLKIYPIFGVGFYNFLIVLPHFSSILTQINYIQPVHNIFLLVASQTGLIGLEYVVWFLHRTFKKINWKNMFSNFKFILLLAVILPGMFDHYFLTLQQGQLLLVLVLAICWSENFSLY